MKNTITVELDGDLHPEYIERIRRTMHELILQGVFDVKNGRAILHFDHEGTLQIVAFDYIKWRRGKEVRT